jgi:ATP-dependent DNA ligase
MKPQKAKHLYLELEKKRPACLDVDYTVFEKYDGWYGYLDHGQPIKSRNQRAIPSLALFSEELNDLGLAKFGRSIFEILVDDMPEFKDLNGYLNRSTGDCEATKAYLKVHDIIPADLSMPFRERWELASATLIDFPSPRVSLANVLAHNSKCEQWKGLAEDEWRLGHEGIVMKRADAGYTPGARNADMLKIKEDLTLDLLVFGTCKGDDSGKYSDTLGTLAVTEKSGTVHLVSGMTDYERNLWWGNPELIVGKVVEIKAMKRLANGSLREPRFKAIRYDKTESDID